MVQTSAHFLDKLEITNLPSLPHVLLNLLDACNNDESSFKALAEIINKDTALSSKILGTANSALYNRPQKITVFEQKLVLLGMDTIRSIAISSSVFQVFSNITYGSEFALKRFWHYSISCATLAKMIAHKVSYPFPDEAYLSGLLLDIGQLVLLSNFPKQYAPLLATHQDETQLGLFERKQFGMTHCEVGSWLIASWNLSSFMSDAALYHHEPLERIQDAHLLIKISRLAHVLGSDEFDDDQRQAVANSLLGISAQETKSMLEKSGEQVKFVAQSLEIDIETNNNGEESPQGAVPTAAPERRKARSAPITPPSESKSSDVDNQKRLQLAREVRDISLIESTRQHHGVATQESILISFQHSFYVLFGLQNALFFLHDQEHDIIYGKSMAGQNELMNELVVPLREGKGMLADALLTRRIHDSFSCRDGGKITLLDEQLIRLSQNEGIYCIPLASRQTSSGVVIFGISKAQLPRLEKQEKLIGAFAQQASQALAASHAQEEQIQLVAYETMTASRAKARQIVHEANNPLSIMKNYIKVLAMKLSDSDPAQEDLGIINEEIDRVAKIIRQFSDAPENTTSLTELSVNGVILDLSRIMKESLFAPYQIAVQTNLDDSLPPIMTDKNKLKQVMINLMKNAAEAMHEGGNLVISTRSNVAHHGINYIEIIFKDDGPGIPKEIMAHLFEPVSTTKGKGHAGLGLAIVKSIMGELKGKISCRSSAQSGTTFILLLPTANTD